VNDKGESDGALHKSSEKGQRDPLYPAPSARGEKSGRDEGE